MSSRVTLIPGRKKGQVNPVMDGYRFCKDRKRYGNTNYRCISQQIGCRARIRLDKDSNLVSSTNTHNHGSQVAETHIHAVKQDLKRKAATSDLPTKYLVAEAAGQLDAETRQKLNCDLSPMYKMARSSRAASSNHPANPTSLEDLFLPGPYITSTSGEPMLLWDSGWSEQHRRSFLFGTLQNTSTLMEADHWVIDGTFKTAPQLMTQMLSVHGILDTSWHIPLIFGLLPGKTQAIYSNIFQELDSFGPYQPQSILCDYEVGLHNAILSVWPSSSVRGCQFHFKQSLWKALQRTDLVQKYNVLNSNIRKFFKILGAFPFLPEDLIDSSWRYVKPLIPSDMNPFYKGCGLLCAHKKSFNTAIPVRSLGPYMYVHYCTCIVHFLLWTCLFLLTSFFDCLSFCGLFLKHPYKRFFPFYILYFYLSRFLSHHGATCVEVPPPC